MRQQRRHGRGSLVSKVVQSLVGLRTHRGMRPAQRAAVSKAEADQLEEVEARTAPCLLAQDGSVRRPLEGRLVGRKLRLEAVPMLHPPQVQLKALLHKDRPPFPCVQPQVLSAEMDCVRLVEALAVVYSHPYLLAPLQGRDGRFDPLLDPQTATRWGAQGAGRA
jgi:hypothetical protein